MKASINLTFTVGADTYAVVLDIPDSPSDAAPFVFTVKDPTNIELLSVAASNDNQYIKLAPPPSLLSPAGVDELSVDVENGSKAFVPANADENTIAHFE